MTDSSKDDSSAQNPDLAVSPDMLKDFASEQCLLKECISEQNTQSWQRLRRAATSSSPWTNPVYADWSVLRYVGGLDLSCPKDDQKRACAALVVTELPSLKVVYKDFITDRVNVPYVPGYLGAREYPLMGRVLERMRKQCPEQFKPQVLLVDGNGILHPRGCGSACHVGVKEKMPCVGVAKNFYRLPKWEASFEDNIRAVRLSKNSGKPVYVSVGSNIDLDTAVWVVKLCSKYRIPEPIRQADLYSRRIIASGGTILGDGTDCGGGVTDLPSCVGEPEEPNHKDTIHRY
ncbi:hypothetical protein RvY_02700-2 [Ramazzottius varieornatus]|uniref:Endonuclease V n=1 Tax=Ramazzottius varieornatus TaxID=947166 RepID=A0A1D1UPD7_RAMVA|nr:hypothetical protein RvY_02700-2 [Ramazzottius varieornatus]